MGVLNPIVSKYVLEEGVTTQVYSLFAPKTHAFVDITIFKENTLEDAIVAIALSTESDPGELSSVDFFFDDIKLLGSANSAELSKVVIGPGERLYLKVVDGPDVVVRVTGVEETNPKVLVAGRLAAEAVVETTQQLLFQDSTQDATFISGSLTIYNPSNVNPATVELWIGTSGFPAASDKIYKFELEAEETTVIENMQLMANEKIHVRSTVANTEYFINGIVVG